MHYAAASGDSLVWTFVVVVAVVIAVVAVVVVVVAVVVVAATVTVSENLFFSLGGRWPQQKDLSLM